VEDSAKAERNCLLRLNAGTHLTNSNRGGLQVLVVEDELDPPSTENSEDTDLEPFG